jgi:hypothetical protein
MSHYVQTVLVPRESFTIRQAARWIISHGYYAIKIDATPNYFRFRQTSPVKAPGTRVRTISLPNSVKLVIYYT